MSVVLIIPVKAESGDLDRRTVDNNGDGAVFYAGLNDAAVRKNVFYLIGASVGRHVIVAAGPSHNGVPYTSRDVSIFSTAGMITFFVSMTVPLKTDLLQLTGR